MSVATPEHDFDFAEEARREPAVIGKGGAPTWLRRMGRALLSGWSRARAALPVHPDPGCRGLLVQLTARQVQLQVEQVQPRRMGGSVQVPRASGRAFLQPEDRGHRHDHLVRAGHTHGVGPGEVPLQGQGRARRFVDPAAHDARGRSRLFAPAALRRLELVARLGDHRDRAGDVLDQLRGYDGSRRAFAGSTGGSKRRRSTSGPLRGGPSSR